MNKQPADRKRLSEAFDALTEGHKRQVLGIFQGLAYAQAVMGAGGGLGRRPADKGGGRRTRAGPFSRF